MIIVSEATKRHCVCRHCAVKRGNSKEC